jgi:hypothetical protein
MPNPQKRKGSDFERLAVELLNNLIQDSEWKRIPGSGAIGTSLGEPLLTADIVGKVKSIQPRFKAEAKVGYGGATQFALKKEWLDKVREEADATYSIPFLVGKFSGSREGVKVFTVLDIETFARIINHITTLQEALDTEVRSRTESST